MLCQYSLLKTKICAEKMWFSETDFAYTPSKCNWGCRSFLHQRCQKIFTNTFWTFGFFWFVWENDIQDQWWPKKLPSKISLPLHGYTDREKVFLLLCAFYALTFKHHVDVTTWMDTAQHQYKYWKMPTNNQEKDKEKCVWGGWLKSQTVRYLKQNWTAYLQNVDSTCHICTTIAGLVPDADVFVCYTPVSLCFLPVSNKGTIKFTQLLFHCLL